MSAWGIVGDSGRPRRAAAVVLYPHPAGECGRAPGNHVIGV